MVGGEQSEYGEGVPVQRSVCQWWWRAVGWARVAPSVHASSERRLRLRGWRRAVVVQERNAHAEHRPTGYNTLRNISPSFYLIGIPTAPTWVLTVLQERQTGNTRALCANSSFCCTKAVRELAGKTPQQQSHVSIIKFTFSTLFVFPFPLLPWPPSDATHTVEVNALHWQTLHMAERELTSP